MLFDRSWYNRAGVERVMGFCTDDEHAEFLRQAPEFERNLARSGIHLIKFWFSVSREEQRRRFAEREKHPLKQWKLSPIDLASLDKWDELHRGQGDDVRSTPTRDEAPWTVIKSDCKKRARLNAMRYVLHTMPYTDKDVERIGAARPAHRRPTHRRLREGRARQSVYAWDLMIAGGLAEHICAGAVTTPWLNTHEAQ